MSGQARRFRLAHRARSSRFRLSPADRDSGYVVSKDDKRFLGIRTDPVQEAREIQVTLNWFEELKRLLPP